MSRFLRISFGTALLSIALMGAGVCVYQLQVTVTGFDPHYCGAGVECSWIWIDFFVNAMLSFVGVLFAVLGTYAGKRMLQWDGEL